MRRLAFIAPIAAVVAAIAVATGPAREHRGPPPIVIVVFDALSTTMLMDATGRIDALRYPHFARLAARATWYPNATMVHDSTIKSVPSILDGRWPRNGQPPDHRGHPRNAFTLFSSRWRIDSAEEATRLCPPRICGRRAPRRRVRDLLHRGREGRYLRAVARVGRPPQPAFHFIHTMLPHEPLRHFPSGRTYQPQIDVEPGLDGNESFHDEFLSEQAFQRHLLQLGYVDRLLGRLIARMRAAGVYDDAVLVVTADHGMSFAPKDSPAEPFRVGHLGFRRDVTAANAHDVMSVPLFVKAPGQRAGRIDRSWARTIDILPTVAELARVKIPWRVDGRSLRARGTRPARLRVLRNEGGALTVPTAVLKQQRAAALARQRRLFGTGSDSLFRIGPNPELIGLDASALPRLPRGRVRARLRAPGRWRRIDLARRYRPALVVGWIRGGRTAGRELAVTVNGRIAAVGRSFQGTGSTRPNLSVLLPEDAFRAGTNRVEVFEVLEGALRPLS